ncbi:MAG: hypothetical protein ACKO4L_00235 [Nodosilinea sp.]
MTLATTALAVTLITAASFALLGLVQTNRQTLTLEDYTVSRNRVGTPMATATIVASAMGAWILFSPPEVGATSALPASWATVWARPLPLGCLPVWAGGFGA